jgi:hypothetical protein
MTVEEERDLRGVASSRVIDGVVRRNNLHTIFERVKFLRECL